MNAEKRSGKPLNKGSEDVHAHERPGLRIDDKVTGQPDISKDGQILADGDLTVF